MRSRVLFAALAAIVVFFQSARAHGQMVASATIAWQQLGPDSYEYDMTLTDEPNSGYSIRSFWFAWIPAYDFLPSAPTSFASPAGWSATDADDTYGTHNSGLWTTTLSPMTPGQTLTGFDFVTTDAPDTIVDGALYDPLDLPVTTSYAYSLPAGRGNGGEFIPVDLGEEQVPEPATALLVGVPAMFFAGSRRRFRGR